MGPGFYSLIHYSSDPNNRLEGTGANLDSAGRGGGVYHLAVTDVDAYVAGHADDIAGLGIGIVNAGTAGGLS